MTTPDIAAVALPSHAWRYLVTLCKRERERLAQIEPIGNMMPLMAAPEWGNLFATPALAILSAALKARGLS